ncbi:MAG: VIT1/CCC1 transporter family protein [Acidimicrobiales bacterium]
MTDQGDSTHRAHEAMEHQHRNVRDGGARAAVFGISDGLVSNVSLVLGIAAVHTPDNVVRLAGFAGLLGGAFSMAAGEYVSMRAQRELFEHEIEIERTEIHRNPDIERQELATLYEGRGLEPALAGQLATTIMMEDPNRALEAHAREELGIDPDSLGSPIQAAVASFIAFATGAAVPLISFFSASGPSATLAAVILTGVAALGVGGVLSIFTGRSWLWSALRQLLICAVAGAATYAIGSAVSGSIG